MTIKNLNDSGQAGSDLEYWLSKTPDERISAVEILRRRDYGNSEGLQRTVRIIQQSDDV